MQIHILPLPMALRERHPYYIFGRYEAEAEMMAAIAEGYGFVHHRYRNVHMDGLVRWAEITENLAQATERFGTSVVNRGGQRRLLWPGLTGEAAEIIVLRGRPDGDRFLTSERGIRSEEHAQLALMSFPLDGGEPMTTGSYLFHNNANEEGYCEAWFAPQGRTMEGWEYVLCDECVHLGQIRFLGTGGGALEPVDIRP